MIRLTKKAFYVSAFLRDGLIDVLQAQQDATSTPQPSPPTNPWSLATAIGSFINATNAYALHGGSSDQSALPDSQGKQQLDSSEPESRDASGTLDERVGCCVYGLNMFEWRICWWCLAEARR